MFAGSVMMGPSFAGASDPSFNQGAEAWTFREFGVIKDKIGNLYGYMNQRYEAFSQQIIPPWQPYVAAGLGGILGALGGAALAIITHGAAVPFIVGGAFVGTAAGQGLAQWGVAEYQKMVYYEQAKLSGDIGFYTQKTFAEVNALYGLVMSKIMGMYAIMGYATSGSPAPMMLGTTVLGKVYPQLTQAITSAGPTATQQITDNENGRYHY